MLCSTSSLAPNACAWTSKCDTAVDEYSPFTDVLPCKTFIIQAIVKAYDFSLPFAECHAHELVYFILHVVQPMSLPRIFTNLVVNPIV